MAGRKRTEKEKDGIIARYRESGMSARDFCRDLDLHHSSLERWIRERRKAGRTRTKISTNHCSDQPLVAVSMPDGDTTAKDRGSITREGSREGAVFRMYISGSMPDQRPKAPTRASRIILEIPMDATAEQLQAIFQAAGAL